MRYLLLAGLVLLAACESNEKKAERLRQKSLSDCLPVIIEEEGGKVAPTADQRAKCDVARREYKKFLDGR